jgi:hypothetical protein
MEWGEVKIWRTTRGFMAEIRGDRAINGDQGCWVTITGWGATEESARESLKAALADLKQKTPEGVPPGS